MSLGGGRRKQTAKQKQACVSVKPSWQPTLNHYFGGKSVSVQPTLQHFIRKAKSGQPITPRGDRGALSQEEQENIQSLVDENVEQMCESSDTRWETTPPANEIKMSGHPQQELHSCLERVSSKAEEKKGFITKDRMTNARNPFAVQHRGVHQTKAAVRDVSMGQGNFPGETGGEKKVLSLKRRKRNLPPSATVKVDGEPSEAKAARTTCGRGRVGKQTRDNCTSRGLTPEGLSSDDLTMLLEYSTPVEESTQLSLRYLEQFESGKKRSGPQAPGRGLPVDTTSSPGTPKRSSLKCSSHLPTTPTFSPRKHPPTSFSPLFEKKCETTLSSEQKVAEEEGSLQVTCRPHDHCSELTSLSTEERGLQTCSVGMSMHQLGCCTAEQKWEHGTEAGAKRLLFHSTKSESLPQDSLYQNSRPGETISARQAADSGSQNDTALSNCNDFSYDGDFSFSFPELMMDQSELEQSNEVTCQSHDLNRYLVLESVAQEYTDDTQRQKPEVVLRLFDRQTNTEKFCHLRDDWLQTDVSPGDVVQVNAPIDPASSGYVVSNGGESLIVDPDQLISGTTVANSISCVRRAVLGEQFRGERREGEAMLMGQLLHEVFQHVLVGWGGGEEVTRQRVEEEIQHVTSTIETLNQLYALGLSETDMVARLWEYVPAMLEWCNRFLHSDPVPGKGDIDFKRVESREGRSCVAVSEILDIEENIWSPRFGLKGKVDVTVRVKEQWCEGGGVEEYRAPLELKTGKMFRQQGTIEHRAQVALYTVMLGDRYSPSSPPGGLLFYLKGGHMQGLPALPHEKRGLLIARNHLARYHGNHSGHVTMPGMLRERHTCKHCPQLPQCMLYHKALECGTTETSGVGDLFTYHTAHLPPSHLAFFATWYSLALQEESYSSERDGRPFWLDTAQEREREGRCLADLVASPAVREGCRFSQLFAKRGKVGAHGLPLSVHERVVVSRQDGTGWAIAIGTISKAISPGEVQLSLDKPLAAGGTDYRLDEAPSHSSRIQLSNLADLCTSDSEWDHRLRELVIDLASPRFTIQESLSIPGGVAIAAPLVTSLNPSQEAAILKVLAAHDYALILGMPGTGKTTTIAYLVQVLVARGNTVMLASYTHSAVDNILLKLKEVGVDFLRLGLASRVHPDILPYTPAHTPCDTSSVKALEQLYHTRPVVATTCLGMHHPIFVRRSFDYCIIDEASQITLPVSLGPLRHTRVFVLVGDHYQLPPLVQSEQAREGGFDVSLFRRLTEHHPTALVSLREQYRMNREIMLLANTLIYNNQLVCGTADVASSRLHIPRWEHMTYPCHEGWLQSTLDPANPVVFLNTDKCEAGESNHLHNDLEAHVVRRMVLELVKGGVDVAGMGVITPYRHQQNMIRKLFITNSDTMESSVCDVEVNTVDRYQGRDKDCIIVSFVRSNKTGNVGTLLHDWRRINVALTRARHKLVLVGSETTLRHIPLLAALLQLLRERAWIVELPPLPHSMSPQ